MGSRIDNGDFDVVLKIIGSIASRLFCGIFYIVFYYRRLRCIEYIAVKNIYNKCCMMKVCCKFNLLFECRNTRLVF